MYMAQRWKGFSNSKKKEKKMILVDNNQLMKALMYY